MDANFSNQLTDAETERLALLLEEMAEASQVIGKILRHGYVSRNPLDNDSPTNRVMLQTELGHVMAALSLMRNTGDVSSSRILEAQEAKLRTVNRWLHHNSSFAGANQDATTKRAVATAASEAP